MSSNGCFVQGLAELGNHFRILRALGCVVYACVDVVGGFGEVCIVVSWGSVCVLEDGEEYEDKCRHGSSRH